MSNSLNEAIDRLQRFWHLPKAEDRISTLKDAIAALSHPLPEEVQEMVDSLRRQGRFNPNFLPIAKLIERLARNYEAAVRLCEMKDDDRDKLQATIEELKADCTAFNKAVVLRNKKIKDLEDRVRDLEKNHD